MRRAGRRLLGGAPSGAGWRVACRRVLSVLFVVLSIVADADGPRLTAQEAAPGDAPGGSAAGVPPAIADGGEVLRSGGLEVVYWPGDRAMAGRTLRAADQPLRLPGIAVAAPPPQARILLAPTPVAFDSLTGGAPHWSAGVAMPAQRRIVLPAYGSGRTPRGDPLIALRHELVHVALNQYLRGRIPRWFDEGYATWASGEWDEGRGWEIRLALLGGGAPPLDSLRLGWPGAEADARLAYLLSASAVSFLATRGGEDAFAAFLDRWRAEADFDAALRGTYGLTLTQFEEQWRAMVKRRYGWLLALSQMGIVWALVGVLLVLLTLPRRRRNREKLRRMEVEDWVDEWRDEVVESETPSP